MIIPMPPNDIVTHAPTHTPVIGIAGPSCSGKTTIAKMLANHLGAAIFHYDSYIKPDAPRVIVNGHPSFDRPDVYDGAKMAGDIFVHMRKFLKTPIIAEGFLLFTDPLLAALCDIKIFLSLDKDTILARRRERREALMLKPDYLSREKPFEDSFLANGIEEWERFGLPQASLSGILHFHGNEPPHALIAQILEKIPHKQGETF